jgi:hypothetical protein
MKTRVFLIFALAAPLTAACTVHAAEPQASADHTNPPSAITNLFTPPRAFLHEFGKYSSLLTFRDGTRVRTPADWQKRRAEIRAEWEREIGTWPPLLENRPLNFAHRPIATVSRNIPFASKWLPICTWMDTFSCHIPTARFPV